MLGMAKANDAFHLAIAIAIASVGGRPGTVTFNATLNDRDREAVRRPAAACGAMRQAASPGPGRSHTPAPRTTRPHL